MPWISAFTHTSTLSNNKHANLADQSRLSGGNLHLIAFTELPRTRCAHQFNCARLQQRTSLLLFFLSETSCGELHNWIPSLIFLLFLVTGTRTATNPSTRSAADDWPLVKNTLLLSPCEWHACTRSQLRGGGGRQSGY